MIYIDERTRIDRSPEVIQAELRQYVDFKRLAEHSGVLRGGSLILPTSAATTLRVRDNRLNIAPGPAVENDQQLAAYFIIECANLDEAADWGSKLPGALGGSVEIRPLATG